MDYSLLRPLRDAVLARGRGSLGGLLMDIMKMMMMMDIVEVGVSSALQRLVAGVGVDSCECFF